MKFTDISGLSVEELRKKSTETSRELFDMKMKNALGQLGNPLEIRFKRREVAKIKTAITQKTAK
ncbi:MAG: 50S ribosomal protein L29 [Bdellovibrionales bacterium]